MEHPVVRPVDIEFEASTRSMSYIVPSASYSAPMSCSVPARAPPPSPSLERVVGAAVVEVVAEAGHEQRQRLQLGHHARAQQVQTLYQLQGGGGGDGGNRCSTQVDS